MLSSLVHLVVLAAAIISVSAVPAPISPCAQVHIIAVRASGEDPGPGIIGSLVTAVQSKSKQTVSTNWVSYPATLDNYASSSSQGTVALKALLTAQVNACPNQKIVLVGYSQGAHVIGDTLAGGGGGLLGATTSPISTTYSSKVAAVVQMGDPRFVAFKSWNAGTSITSGMFPRLSSQVYPSSLIPKIKSYCDFNDLFCASGLSTLVHLTYLSRYENNARDFIISNIGS